MTATGSHFDFDSLRGAPLARNDFVLFGHFAILRQLPTDSYGGFLSREAFFALIRHGCAVPPFPEGKAGGAAISRHPTLYYRLSTLL